jgi:hypothetical protein
MTAEKPNPSPRDYGAHRAPLQRFWQTHAAAYQPFSLERGSVQQLFGGIAKSHTRVLVGSKSSPRLSVMKSIHSLNRLQVSSPSSAVPIVTTHWRIKSRERLSWREALPLWFAVSSPLIGIVIGFLGAWFVSWLTS